MHSAQHVGPSSARNNIKAPALADSGGFSDSGRMGVCVEDPMTISSVSSISWNVSAVIGGTRFIESHSEVALVRVNNRTLASDDPETMVPLTTRPSVGSVVGDAAAKSREAIPRG